LGNVLQSLGLGGGAAGGAGTTEGVMGFDPIQRTPEQGAGGGKQSLLSDLLAKATGSSGKGSGPPPIHGLQPVRQDEFIQNLLSQVMAGSQRRPQQTY
jgi:hypothetical protein